jgi:hypothetical protein
VTVRGTAAKPQQRQVILAIDGKEYGRRSVDLPASTVAADPVETEGGDHLTPELGSRVATTSSAKVLFADLKLAAGSHRLEVSLDPSDALPQDDRFYAVLEHADPKALLVAPDARADDVSYFASAIGSLAAPTLSVEERAADAIGTSALTGFSLLVVADMGALSDIQAKRIKEYVRPAAPCSRRSARALRSSRARCSKTGASASRSKRLLQWARSRRRIRCCRDAGDWHSCALSSDIAQSSRRRRQDAHRI